MCSTRTSNLFNFHAPNFLKYLVSVTIKANLTLPIIAACMPDMWRITAAIAIVSAVFIRLITYYFHNLTSSHAVPQGSRCEEKCYHDHSDKIPPSKYTAAADGVESHADTT